MKAEFNPDGSLKLPAVYEQAKLRNQERMRNQACIRIQKIMVSEVSPKKCLLKITLSEKICDQRFVENIFNQFKERAEVPSKLSKTENGFEIEIGTCFRRCTDCCSLISQYREFLDGNIIEDSCNFEQNRNFCYEDYFD